MRKAMWLLFIVANLLYLIPYNLFGMNFTLSDLIFVLMFYIIIIYKMMYQKTPVLPILNKNYYIIWYILFFIGIGCLLSLTKSTNIVGSMSNFIQYLFIFVVLLTIIEYLVDEKANNAIRIISIFLIPNILIVAITLLSKFGVYNVLDHYIISFNGRFQGFEGIPTKFGTKMATTFVLVFMFFKMTKKKGLKTISLFVSALFMYAALLSGSFGSVLLIFIGVFFILWFAFDLKLITRILALISVLAAVFFYYQIEINQNYSYLAYAPEIIEKRFYSSGQDFGSVEVRSDLNKLGVQSFLENPLVGVGYGQFQFNNVTGQSVHNTLVSAAAEMGVIGALGVFLYLFTPILYSKRIYELKKLIGRKELTLASFLLIYALMRLFNTLKAQEFINREVWIPILIIFVLYDMYKNNSAKRKYV